MSILFPIEKKIIWQNQADSTKYLRIEKVFIILESQVTCDTKWTLDSFINWYAKRKEYDIIGLSTLWNLSLKCAQPKSL